MSPQAINHGGGVDSGGALTIVELLRRNAKQSSEISRSMAEAKSLRQDGNSERRTDLYMWSAPEQTIEGIAAHHIEAQSRLLTKSLCTLQALVSNMEESGWQPIETAPRNGTVIQASIPGHGADNIIAWQAGLIDSDGNDCGGWCFVTEQEPPDCWTDGWCWETNEDGVPSVKPTEWKPDPAAITASLGTFDLEALKTLVGEIEEVRGRAA